MPPRRRQSACIRETTSQAFELQVVRIVAGEIGVDADQDDGSTGRYEAAGDQLLADQATGRVDVLADVGADRDDAPINRQLARGLVAIGGREDRRAWAQRREAARGATATGDGDDRVGVAAVGKRDGRLA